MKLKRFVSLVVCMAMLFAFAVPAVPVLANDITISVAAVGSGFSWGDDVPVRVSISNPSTRSVASISFLDFTYDPAVLEWAKPISAYDREVSSTWPFSAGAISTSARLFLNAPEHIFPGRARFTFDSELDFNGGGVLLNLELKVRDGAPLAPTAIGLAWAPSSDRPGAGVNAFNGDVVNATLQGSAVPLVEMLWAGVGAPSGHLIAGVPGTVTYNVTTTLVPNGSHNISVAGLPSGVTAVSPMNINNGTGTLTLNSTAAAAAANLTALRLSIAGATSANFPLEIRERSLTVNAPAAPLNALTIGLVGRVNYTVNATNFANGTYPVTVSNLPAGVAVQGGSVAVNNGTGTLTLVGNPALPARTVSNMQLSMAGINSGNFSAVIAEQNLGSAEYPPRIRGVGSANAEWYVPSSGPQLSWPHVNDALNPVQRGTGVYFLALNRSSLWAFQANHAMITVTNTGMTVQDAGSTHDSIPVAPIAGSNARFSTHPSTETIYVSWGPPPAGYTVVPLNNGRTIEFGVSEPVVLTNPTVNWPTGLSAETGQTLSDITLSANTGGTPGTFHWTAGGGTSVGAAGQRQFSLTFVPNVTTNEAGGFTSVSSNVTVNVGQTQNETFTVNITGAGANSIIPAAAVEAGTIVAVFAGVQDSQRFNAWSSQQAVSFFAANQPFTTFVMPAQNVTINASWTNVPYIAGDVTGTGSATAVDVELLRRFLVASNPIAFRAANPNFILANASFDNNGIVNTFDLTRLKALVG